ncbi:MAG: flagellar hook-basal body complex protein FliE [Clostridiaceae bacterium]|jgi:flagellar hook-basal body complex protein FliE|nr:flagellar hook-basal body complex protein FliE [Clostridiaceae bacterium]
MAFKVGTADSLAPSHSILETGSKTGNPGAIPFADYLKLALYRTNDLLLEVDRLADDFAAGRTDNIHQVMLAGEKANIALQFTLQIRNKLLDAYNEIMRMQI